MVSKSVAIFATFLALSRGFIIPEDQSNGLYRYSEDESGKGHHIFVRNITEPKPSSAKFLRRDGPVIFPIGSNVECGDQSCTADDWAASTNALIAGCSPETDVGSGEHIYAVSGGCIAYMCNEGGPNVCVDVELRQALTEIGGSCLNYAQGTSIGYLAQT